MPCDTHGKGSGAGVGANAGNARLSATIAENRRQTMTALQVYEQTIKPLSRPEKLAIARLIINEFEPQAPLAEAGFDYLKRFLPQIERITLTEQDLAGVTLNRSTPRKHESGQPLRVLHPGA
jgi:hypothetical protein